MRRKLKLYESRDDADVDATPTDKDVFGRGAFFRTVRGKWKVGAGGELEGSPDSSKQLKIAMRSEQARNNYSDGYDLPLARSTREERKRPPNSAQADGLTDAERGDRSGPDSQAVSDLRIGFDLSGSQTPDKLRISIEIASKGISYELLVEQGKGRLRASATKPGPTQTVTSEPFDLQIPAGEQTSVRFARLDDRLYAWRDGDLIAQFDVDSIPIKERLELRAVDSSIEMVSQTAISLSNVTVERDLHYTRSRLKPDEIIEVPQDHFFMMGDNTLGSADGRDWAAVRIAVDAQGRIVDPEKDKSARVMWGNRRTKPFVGAGKPHDDDNPVPLYDDRVVFVDHLGEIHGLKGKVDADSWGETEYVQFLGAPTPWMAKEEKRSFVPRDHIEGRPLARFLRSLSSFKTVGWIR